MINCHSLSFNDPLSRSLKHLWLELWCGTPPPQRPNAPTPTDLHLQYRETIHHILQKQQPTNRFSIESKWLFLNQCDFSHMRHINYCHLAPRQVICQTAGSCMLSLRLYSKIGFPVKKGAKWMKAHFNIKAGMMKNLTLHVPLNTPKPRVECINLLHAGARVRWDVNCAVSPHKRSHIARFWLSGMHSSCDLCLVTWRSNCSILSVGCLTEPTTETPSLIKPVCRSL